MRFSVIAGQRQNPDRGETTAEAYAIVTPEHNNGYQARLKDALDHLNKAWRYKAIGFVPFGGVSGGLRAVAQLKQAMTMLRVASVTDAVVISFIANHVSGGLGANDAMRTRAKAMLRVLAVHEVQARLT